ncbi:MAG: CoA transferase [Deltaproteobacteria bacterium]|nr:CoA transferase [Deltaproteobacteria bacterium]
MFKQALEGITIADFGQTWAGPHLTRTLGDMGARIIKIESLRRMDVIRSLPPFPKEEDHTLNNSGYYNWLNRNKMAVTLDLTTDKGSALAKELIKISDALVENYSRGVMEKFGLDYESVKKVNPGIIYAALTSMGMDGPYKDFAMYGRPQVYVSGLAEVTGYPDGPPLSVMSWGDPVAAHHGAFALLAALRHRKKTGLGQFIELSQWESLICLSPETILEYSLNGRIMTRQGNRHEVMAPHNSYQCREPLDYLNIAVSSDEEWKALCRVMGSPAWADEEKFADPFSRWQNQEELDRHIEEWTMESTSSELTKQLQEAGVAAFPSLSNRRVVEDPHLKARGYFEEWDHPEAGRRQYDGILWKMSKTPGKIRMRAPMVGEHNQYVFGELLGMSGEEIDRLIEEKVIA